MHAAARLLSGLACLWQGKAPAVPWATAREEGYASSGGGSSSASSMGKPPSPDAFEAPAPAPLPLSANATPRTSEDVPAKGRAGAKVARPAWDVPAAGAARDEPRSSTEWGPLRGVKRSRSAASLPSATADQALPPGFCGSLPALSRGAAAAAFAQLALQAAARGAAEGGAGAAKGSALPGGAAAGARAALEMRDTCAEAATLATWEGVPAGGGPRQHAALAKQAETDAGAGEGTLPGAPPCAQDGPAPALGAMPGGGARGAGSGLQAAAEEAVHEITPCAEGAAEAQLLDATKGRSVQGNAEDVTEAAAGAQGEPQAQVFPSAAADGCGKAGEAAPAPEAVHAAAGSGKEGKEAAGFEGPGGTVAPAHTWLGTYRDAALERRFCAWQAAQLVQARRRASGCLVAGHVCWVRLRTRAWVCLAGAWQGGAWCMGCREGASRVLVECCC